MQTTINILETINEKVGRFFSWSALAMVILICAEVMMRYVFNTTFMWMVELETYFFAFCFLMAAGYAFKHDRHVRVDLFYSKFSPKKKAWTDLLGGLLFLVPWCVVAIIQLWKYALKSFKIAEHSQQPGGLPMLYLLKFALFFGFCFLLLQGIASILRSIQTIRGK